MNSGKIYELKVHSHFKEVGHDTIEGIAGSSAIEIQKKKEFWDGNPMIMQANDLT